MRTLLIYAIAACIGDAGAQIVSRDSVHLKPVGTVVRDTFVLGNKTLPLPEGEFVLAAVELHDSRFVRGDYARQQHKMVDVALAQMADQKLRTFVWASAVLKHGGTSGWVSEPCKQDDVLFKQSRVPFMKNNYEQNCLTVNQAGSLGTRATGAFVTLAEWARSQGVKTPLPTVIDATITRISVADFLVVRYAFNADAYGCIVKRGEPSPLVDGVVAFGKEMQIAVNEGFIGRRESVERLAMGAPQPNDCGAPPRQRATSASRAKPGSVAERLKTLDALRDQGLVTPEEYEERRKKILDSL
jgi:hypothetical protein